MLRRWWRLAMGMAVAVASVSAVVVASQPAQAGWVTSGQVTFSGEPGAGLASGLSYSYSTSQGIAINAAYRTDWPGKPLVIYSSDSSHYWEIEFAAPPGQELAVGTYLGAVRTPFNDVGQPGLDLTIGSGGCNTVTGSFTIYQLTLGADGSSVESLNATFEHHCDGATPAIRGRVLINVAGPPALTMKPSVAATGSVTAPRSRLRALSFVTVNGTTTCTQAAQLTITGTVTQASATAGPPLSGTVACAPGTAVAWTASGWVPPMRPGSATVSITISAFDPYYLIPVNTAYAPQLVQLVDQPSAPISPPRSRSSTSAAGSVTNGNVPAVQEAPDGFAGSTGPRHSIHVWSFR